MGKAPDFNTHSPAQTHRKILIIRKTENMAKPKTKPEGAGGQSAIIEQIPTAELIPYARNSRTHSELQVQQIAGSIQEFGFCNPVLIDAENGIIAGHGRVMAAHLLKLATVPCLRLTHLTDAQKRAYVIADNRLALNSAWDTELLANELSDLHADDFDLGLLGFDAEELETLLGFELTDQDAGEIVEDEVPEVPADPITKPGNLWILGKHRLLCGDSTKADDVGRLMNGSTINIAFTSPPYASQRKYDESSGFKPIPPDEFVKWFEPIAANVKGHLAADGSWFVNIKPACEGLYRLTYVFDLVLAHIRQWGWNFAEEFCWERTGIPQQVVRRFKNQFEPIYQFTRGEWKIRPEAVRHQSSGVPVARGKGAGDTNAAKRQGTMSAVEGNEVVEGMAYPGNRLPKFQSEALGHSAAFPVGLPSFFIKAFTDESDTVYEPFCGSGSTLIAAEQLNRKCYGMEISPQYCDVIVKRWENLTGKMAVLEGD
jgi:DNA modification methylase